MIEVLNQMVIEINFQIVFQMYTMRFLLGWMIMVVTTVPLTEVRFKRGQQEAQGLERNIQTTLGLGLLILTLPVAHL